MDVGELFQQYLETRDGPEDADRDFFTRLREIYEFHSLSIDILRNTRARHRFGGIDLRNGDILFRLLDPNLLIKSDGSVRAAPMEILAAGGYEEAEYRLTVDVLRGSSKGSYLDVGCHIGYTALRLRAHAFPMTYYCFEPVPNTYAVLLDNISLNEFTDVTPVNIGIGPSGEVAFQYSRCHAPLASALLGLSGRGIAENDACTIAAHCEGLDDAVTRLGIDRISFIKIDAEGAEFSAVTSARESILRWRPGFMIELYAPWCRLAGYTIRDVCIYFESHGYHCYRIGRTGILQKENATTIAQEQLAAFSTDYNFFFFNPESHSTILETITNANYKATPTCTHVELREHTDNNLDT